MSERADIVITVEKRSDLGKGAVRRLRRAGQIPAVVYGGDKPPASILIEEEALKEILSQTAGENTIFLLKLKRSKEERRAMIREIQRDPISGAFKHIDFIRVTRGQKLTVSMPIELEGDCVGVRRGGRIDFVTRDLAIEILPREMFDRITVDISELDVGQNIRVGELEDKLPESARFLEDLNRVVVTVVTPRVVEEEEEELEEEAVIEEAAEPELIRKGKEEGEESEGE